VEQAFAPQSDPRHACQVYWLALVDHAACVAHAERAHDARLVEFGLDRCLGGPPSRGGLPGNRGCPGMRQARRLARPASLPRVGMRAVVVGSDGQRYEQIGLGL
jgi:hypothetical protein